MLVKSRVQHILMEEGRGVVGVRLANGDLIRSKCGVVSDAGIYSTIQNLLPVENHGPLKSLIDAVGKSSGGISHATSFASWG